MEKRRRTINPAFDSYIVEERIAQEDPNDEMELRRLYFSCIDSVCGEIKERFGERNCAVTGALKALDPEDADFLDASKITPLLKLTNTSVVDTEFHAVAHRRLPLY
ncbi:hypothetical protein VZT92_002067 [Zoarces viviparus]|uniref:Uncharacterized protein n=1 Tax=Zoarces viviparus TaxID=48416 RepID=A0AAW1G5C6_ZOAVI